MQSIERYGLVALLFLVVTVVAAVVWEGDPKDAGADSKARVAHAADREVWNAEPAPAPLSQPAAGAASDAASAHESTVSMRARPQRQPISRDSFQAAREAERQEALRRRSEVAQAQPDSAPAARQVPEETAAEVRQVADVVPPASAPQSREVSSESTSKAGGSAEKRVYVVKSTDTLSEIAQKELGTFKRWKEIVALNPGLDPAKLHVGLKLVLPSEGEAAPAAKERVASADPTPEETKRVAKADPARAKKVSAARTYVVKRGDSLWKIATNELGDGKRWPEIVDRNPNLDPDRLAEGRVLELPEGSAAARPEARTTPSQIVATNTGSRPKRTVR